MADQIGDMLEHVQRPQIARLQARAEAAEAEAALYRSLVADAVVLIAASPRFSSKDPWIARARAALGTPCAPRAQPTEEAT